MGLFGRSKGQKQDFSSLPSVGKAAIERGDLKNAFEVFSKLADNGDAEGQCRLAFLYKVSSRDFDRAAYWYKKAAVQDHPEAQCKLGLLYRHGQGLPQNDGEAVHWYRKSAEQGYAEAQHNLGFCLETGAGTTKNIAEAMIWYRRAAEQGYAESMLNLGRMYAFGEGVPKDYSQALVFFTRAAQTGNSHAQWVAWHDVLRGKGCNSQCGRGHSLASRSRTAGKRNGKTQPRSDARIREFIAIQRITCAVAIP
jgi:TPR repeat protein